MTQKNTADNKNLSSGEISQRISILKRFKKLLEQQREKFQQYLQVLEAQELSIDDENVENIVEHAQLGQSIISEIASIKKVIDPLESMYKTVHTQGLSLDNTDDTVLSIETEKLKADLQSLQQNILIQNKKNRDKLKTHVIDLRQQMASMQRISHGKNIFSAEGTASIVDVEV